jgi:hypothetical protein
MIPLQSSLTQRQMQIGATKQLLLHTQHAFNDSAAGCKRAAQHCWMANAFSAALQQPVHTGWQHKLRQRC